ncbi:FAD binding domain containing protein [Lasiodiplodia theobromae]|uniref:FAD binding domain containing protein n=1 Tax=Lasiodiplodia theobromae TaxID=45133 RepID=UPI0015C34CDD|nr:FAD binding domain containing protein [Lasiodiplodia theobromae]KAF4540718.1 FAD binding domain containing protein [Lasiodiplodia theobromae]
MLLQTAGLEHVYFPEDPAYTQRIDSYWSLTAQLTPYCIVEPETAPDVSRAVTTLVHRTACNFAVRSGGHSANAGANNIDAGVTIDLHRMNSTTHNPATATASLLPGARWLDVYQHLDALNLSVQGGRNGGVGVGGLVLGGGCSYYMYARGLVCDSVRGFEVVLANGTIIEANARGANADLWRALKGGGAGNFGIVTRVDMEVFPRTPIWVAARRFPAGLEGVGDKHVEALVEWVDGVAGYRNASALVFWTYKPADNGTVVNTRLTDVGGRAAPPVFDKFLAIEGNISSDVGMTNLSTLSPNTVSYGYRNIWLTLTFKNDARMLKKVVELHDVLVEEMKQVIPDGDFETQAFFQPLPTIVSQHSIERGGNILGIDKIEDNAIIWLGSVAVNTVEQEEIGRQKIYAWKDAVEEYSKSIGAFLSYRYCNYAEQSQSVMRSYGEENFRKMQVVADKYDPERVFQTRVPVAEKWEVRAASFVVVQ